MSDSSVRTTGRMVHQESGETFHFTVDMAPDGKSFQIPMLGHLEAGIWTFCLDLSSEAFKEVP